MKYLLFFLGLFISVYTNAQKIPISGVVTDSLGIPVPAVTVMEKGTTNGTSTNEAGRFRLSVEPNATLILSSIGYENREVTATTNMRISLLTNTTEVGRDVVVVAYGTQQRAKLTSSQTTISTQDFRGQPVTRVDQALQGRAAGVQVTNASGAPGSDVRIRIRGANSINFDNGPLYVIDGFVGADFNVLNPDDIADIQILKDAAATAPYGSRGANGVIIITTKRGAKGKANYSFRTRQSSSVIPKLYSTLDAADFAQAANEYNLAVGQNAAYTDAEVQQFRTNGGTDWQKEIFQKAYGQQYEFGVDGGNDVSNYYISLGYQDQPGVIKNSFYKFYNVRSNINVNLTSKLSTFINFNGFVRNNQNTVLRQGKDNPVNQAMSWAPTVPARDENGNFTIKDPIASQGYNPVAEAFDRMRVGKNYNANIIGGLRYRITEPLTLSIQYGADYGTSNFNDFGDVTVSSEGGYAGKSTSTSLTLQNTNTINYHKLFNSAHDLDLTGVLELQKWQGEGFNAGISGLIYPAFMWNNLAFGTPSQPGSWTSSTALMSLFARANYSYLEKYMISATVRRDASSVFRGKNKASIFPSLSVGWNIAKESFMDNSKLFNILKLRGSWGLTGNQAIGPYTTYSTYGGEQATFNTGAGVPAIVIANSGNPDLKWETTEQINGGLDFGLVPLAIHGSIDYFVKNTRDLLFWVGLPDYTGGGSVLRNVGQVQNKGWEFTLGATPVNNKLMYWKTDVNYSIINNKIVKLTDDQNKIFHDPNVGWGMTEASEFLLEVGKPMAGLWGVNYLGTWKPNEAAEAAKFGAKPGDSRYEDLNGDNKIDENDFKVIGYGLPKYTLGWNNTFNVKGVELNVLIQGVYGFDKMNILYGGAMINSGDLRYATMNDIKNRYIPGQNETSDIPAFSTTNKHFLQSSRFVYRGDFTRIKNIGLAYTIAKEKLSNIASVRLSFAVTNAFTFTKYNGMDPETSNIGSGSDAGQSIDFGGYPIPRIYTVGVNINF